MFDPAQYLPWPLIPTREYSVITKLAIWNNEIVRLFLLLLENNVVYEYTRILS